MTDTVTDSAGTSYEIDAHKYCLRLEGADGDTQRVYRGGDHDKGRVAVGYGNGGVIVEAEEYIRQVAKLAGLEVTIGDAAPDQSEPVFG